MKKILMGIAVVVFVIGLSAFTYSKANNKSAKTVYYWYKVDYTNNASGEILQGTTNFFTGSVTKDISDATAEDDCTTTGSRDCLRGFSSPQTFPSTSTSPGDVQTPKL